MQECPGHGLAQQVLVAAEAALEVGGDLGGEALEVGERGPDDVGVRVQDDGIAQLVGFNALEKKP